jgi:hypothetical protein
MNIYDLEYVHVSMLAMGAVGIRAVARWRLSVCVIYGYDMMLEYRMLE